MSDWQSLQQAALFNLPLTLIVLSVLACRGVFTGRAFEGRAPRRTGMGGADVLIALGTIFIGMLLPASFGLGPGLLDAERPPAPGMAGEVIAVQLLQFAPPVTALLLLAWAAPKRVEARRRAAGKPTGARVNGWHALGLVTGRPWRDVGVGLLALLAALPLVAAVMLAAQALDLALGGQSPAIGHGLLQKFLEAESAVTLGLLCLSAVGLAPLLEELVFRGLFQSAVLGLIGQSRRWTGIAIVSLIFASKHIGPATFGEGQIGVAWYALPGLFVLSLMLGYLYERHHSLWPASLLHAGFNAVNVALVLSGLAGA